MPELYGEVTFYLTDDPEVVEALKSKAREVDEGEEPEAGYTLAQAFQVVWHLEPEWLVPNKVLDGWTLDKATDEDGNMRDVWPS